MRTLTLEKQTKLHDPEFGVRGNCMVACYANYLGFKIEQCPAFEEIFSCTKPNGFWWDTVLLWWEQNGYKLHYSTSHDDVPKDIKENDFYFVSGISPRNPQVYHLVIYQKGKLFFDPHPSGDGIIEGSERFFEWVIPNN